MRFIVLLIIGILNVYFGMRKRKMNAPLAPQYKKTLEQKYTIKNEMALRDFEEFAVVMLGAIIIIAAIGMKGMEMMQLTESFQLKILLVVAIIAVYSYRTVRGSFLEKKSK